MKRFFIALLAALLLCGCQNELPDYALPEAADPATEPAQPSVSERAEAPTPSEHFNTYEPDYETVWMIGTPEFQMQQTPEYLFLGGSLVKYYDFALQKKLILCSQPNCAHCTEDCPAFLSFGGSTYHAWYRNKVYAILDNADNVLTLVEKDPASGAQRVIADLSAPDGQYRNLNQSILTGDSLILTAEDIRPAIMEDQQSTAKLLAVDLNSGAQRVLQSTENSAGGYMLWGATEQTVLYMDCYIQEPVMLLSEEEYLAQGHTTEEYERYIDESSSGTQEHQVLKALNLATGESRTVLEGDFVLLDPKAFYKGICYYARGNTVYAYDPDTDIHTELFLSPIRPALLWCLDGRVFYTARDERHEAWSYYWYELETGELRQFQKDDPRYDALAFSGQYETKDALIGIYAGIEGTCYISKQDFYNENYAAAVQMFGY